MNVDVSEFAEVLDDLVNTDAMFKLQHKDEPDLTSAEKRKIASDLLLANVGQFLYRFGRYIPPKQLVLFDKFRDDYAVNLFLNERSASETASGRRKTAANLRNRRLAAVEDMMDESDYFSELEMKKRDPRLYEEMVGQFMTEEEKLALESHVGTSREEQKLSTILTDHYVLAQRRAEAEMEEGTEQIHISDDDDEEGEEEEEEKSFEEGPPELPSEEKHRLREEFRDIMVERFISGKDNDFDYQSLDANPRYASDAIEDQDAEDSYFDSEHPAEALDD